MDTTLVQDFARTGTNSEEFGNGRTGEEESEGNIIEYRSPRKITPSTHVLLANMS